MQSPYITHGLSALLNPGYVSQLLTKQPQRTPLSSPDLLTFLFACPTHFFSPLPLPLSLISSHLPLCLFYSFYSRTTSLIQAMAKPVFYSIVKAIRSGEQESLQFTNLDPEDCSLVLESLADPRNALEERAFR